MFRLALIRPGSCDFDQQGRIQGKLNLPLNQQGEEDVARLIDALKDQNVETVYSAQGEPTEDTAHQLADALGARCKVLSGLVNVDHGLWEGMLGEDVKRKHPKVYRLWREMAENVCPPEGETFGEVRERVLPRLEKLLRKNTSGFVLVAPEALRGLIRSCLQEGVQGVAWEVQQQEDRWEFLQPKSLVASSPDRAQ
ncbi:MAG: histidine phosphatase family protein [Planctomycetales bacterium]